MPSIAQQDYLRPQGKGVNDCHLLAALAHNIQQGTIFDTIMAIIYEGEDETDYCRVLTSVNDKVIFYYDGNSAKNQYINITHTQTQYEGLAAVQDALENYGSIPIVTDDGVLAVEVNGALYDLKVDGKALNYTTDANGNLAGISLSESSPNDPTVEISWEDAQKLIGLPIA